VARGVRELRYRLFEILNGGDNAVTGFWKIGGVLCACLFMLAAEGWAGDSPDTLKALLLQLARDGRNAEAIAVYEQLKESPDIPAEVLRAAASCYWRERRLEESRALYRRILERHPGPRPAAGGEDQPPLQARSDLSAKSTPGDGGVVPPSKESVLRQELVVLKAAYLELEADRERIRREADARMAVLSDETELRIKEISELRERLPAGSASVAGARDHEVERQMDAVEQGTLDLALKEIERMELEYARLDAERASQLAALNERISSLESGQASATESQAAAEKERDDERKERQALAERYDVQAEQLQRAKSLVEKAAAALERHYDAMREQVQGSVTIRIADGNEVPRTEEESMPVSSDLAPLIGRLEEATASAAVEVQQLRNQLEKERALFAEAVAESERNRAMQVNALMLQMDEMSAAVATREAGMVEAHARAMEAMRVSYDRELAGLNKDLDAIRTDLEGRNRDLEALESDLESEQQSTARVLSLARANEVTLGERIRELEASVKQALTRAAMAVAEGGGGAVEGRAPHVDAGGILAMIPKDPGGAISRFESLSPEAELPVELLKAMGNAYREQRKYEPALRLFERMLARVPGDPYAERKIVMTLFDMGLYDQALDRLAKPEQRQGQAVR